MAEDGIQDLVDSVKPQAEEEEDEETLEMLEDIQELLKDGKTLRSAKKLSALKTRCKDKGYVVSIN